MMQKPLSDADAKALERLNAAVDEAITARTAWLDAKMVEYATVAVGETLYDLATGEALGVVKKHYRWFCGNVLRDKALVVHYQCETEPGMIDNTSRLEPKTSFGSREEAVLCMETEAACMAVRAALLRGDLTGDRATVIFRADGDEGD